MIHSFFFFPSLSSLPRWRATYELPSIILHLASMRLNPGRSRKHCTLRSRVETEPVSDKEKKKPVRYAGCRRESGSTYGRSLALRLLYNDHDPRGRVVRAGTAVSRFSAAGCRHQERRGLGFPVPCMSDQAKGLVSPTFVTEGGPPPSFRIRVSPGLVSSN
jgi:hypothetical protein